MKLAAVALLWGLAIFTIVQSFRAVAKHNERL